MGGEEKPKKEVKPLSVVLKKAGKKALGGGVAGALAMVAQVALLMWMRTVMNYQHANGLSTWDGDWRSFAARLLGLVACVGLLMLVSGQLSHADLGTLALELAGLSVVHVLVLLLLMTRVVLRAGAACSSSPLTRT